MTGSSDVREWDRWPAAGRDARGWPAGWPAAASERRRGVRVAVVGGGYWGSKHIRVLSGLRDVDRVVLVDANPRIHREILPVFPSLDGFPDLESALPYVDAVVIATPPQSHAELALMALRDGKHVLVEKPLATSVAEARSLVDEARRANRVLMVGHIFQFNSAVRELRKRLAQGELGKIYYIHSARLNLGLYRPDVNVVWDLAPHDISILNYLLCSTPTRVAAWGTSLACSAVEDLAYIRLEYEEVGVTAFVHLSWLDPRKVRTVTVVGNEKMAVYDDLAEERLRIYDRGVTRPDGGSAPHERPLSYRYGDITSPYIRFDEPLALEDQHFLDCIRHGGTPEAPGSAGVAVTAVLEAVDRSLSIGTPLEVDYPSDAAGSGDEGREPLAAGAGR